MTPGIRPLVAGNWKMNGTSASLNELRMIGNGFMSGLDAETEALVCVPATLLAHAAEILSRTPVHAGGEDCHTNESGAYTGCISAEMLKDAGATHVIVGHSECREQRGEDDATVQAKASAAWRAGLVAIICIGETQQQREAGATLDVLSRQVAGSVPPSATPSNTIIAYEPVWAIGTGETATPEDAQEMCEAIRNRVDALYDVDTADAVRVLYGGSVKSSNVALIMAKPDVDGALVGGASLDPEEFAKIVRYQSHAVAL